MQAFDSEILDADIERTVLREQIPDALETLRSDWSGTAFPADAVEGQTCWRIDLQRRFEFNGASWAPKERIEIAADFAALRARALVHALASNVVTLPISWRAGDGGGVFDKLADGDSTADDGAAVAADAAGNRWRRRSNEVDLRQYDWDRTGATNAATVLNAAAARAAGSKLILGAGIILLGTTAFAPPSNVEIVGEGRERTQLKFTGDVNSPAVLLSNKTDIAFEGVGVNYTPNTFTLGYNQCGISVRNGSKNIRLSHCGVFGRVNRGVNILNVQGMLVEDLITTLCGDAALRIVSDNAADSLTAFVTRDIEIRNSRFYGGATRDATTPECYYALNICGEIGAGDMIHDVIVSNCHARVFDAQGFTAGGNARGILFENCSVRACDAYGFLTTIYGGVNPVDITHTACNVSDGLFGFWDEGGYNLIKQGCRVQNTSERGFNSKDTLYSHIKNCQAFNVATYSYFLQNADYAMVNGNLSAGAGNTGFYADSATQLGSARHNQSVASVTANYNLASSGLALSENI